IVISHTLSVVGLDCSCPVPRKVLVYSFRTFRRVSSSDRYCTSHVFVSKEGIEIIASVTSFLRSCRDSTALWEVERNNSRNKFFLIVVAVVGIGRVERVLCKARSGNNAFSNFHSWAFFRFSVFLVCCYSLNLKVTSFHCRLISKRELFGLSRLLVITIREVRFPKLYTSKIYFLIAINIKCPYGIYLSFFKHFDW